MMKKHLTSLTSNAALFCLVLFLSLGLSLPLSSQNVTPGLATFPGDTYGARFRAFDNGPVGELYVGTNDLGNAANRNQAVFNYANRPGVNGITVTYDAGTSTLTATHNGNTVSYPVVGDLFNVVQLNVANRRGPSSTCQLNNVELDGNALGNFQPADGTQEYYVISNYDFSGGFTITADITLGGTNGNNHGNENNRVEFTLGVDDNFPGVCPEVSINQFGGNPFDEVCPDEQAVFLASPPANPNDDSPAVESYEWTFSSNNSSAVSESGAGGGGTGQLANDGTPRRIGATWSASGTETVDLTVTFENGCVVDAPTHDVNVIGDELPDPWVQDDLGQSSQPGEAGFDNCGDQSFTLSSTATPFPTSSDNYTYVHQSVCGSMSSITARITDYPENGYAGLFIRNGIGGADAGLAVLGTEQNPTTPSPLLQIRFRQMMGSNLGIEQHNRPYPFWLRLRRQGNWVFADYSVNGTTWRPVTAKMLFLNECVELGMVVQSNDGSVATASFDNVVVDGGNTINMQTPTPTENTVEYTQQKQLQLFPNPTSGYLILDGLATESDTQLNLRNQLGQIIDTRQIGSFTNRLEWNVSDLDPGAYIIEVTQGEQVPKLLRFIKVN